MDGKSETGNGDGGTLFPIAFTGNRPKDEPGRSLHEIEAMRPQLEEIFRAVGRWCSRHGWQACLRTSVASGADLVACETALAMGMPVHLVLPMPVNEFRGDFEDDPEAWCRAENILKAVRSNGPEVEELPLIEDRASCYERANRRILESARMLVAMTNEVSTGLVGGAWQLLDQAGERGLPIVHLNPANGEVRWSDSAQKIRLD